eukprot:60565_1
MSYNFTSEPTATCTLLWEMEKTTLSRSRRSLAMNFTTRSRSSFRVGFSVEDEVGMESDVEGIDVSGFQSVGDSIVLRIILCERNRNERMTTEIDEKNSLPPPAPLGLIYRYLYPISR